MKRETGRTTGGFGQLFHIVLTFAVVWLLLSGRFFPLPNLAL